MVFDLVRALGVPLSPEIATHIYLAILTDTGSFHYSSISPRTFDICRETLEAGVDPVLVARNVYDSNNMGRLKLFGAVLSAMQIDPTGRIAIVYLDHEMARAAGGTYEDTEGLINLPLTVKEIQAVVFFKQVEGDEYRVSMRSKGDIDIGAVAKEFGGGGHKNAAGCTVTGAIDALQKLFVEKIEQRDRSRSRMRNAGRLTAVLAVRSALPIMDGLLVVDKPVGPTSHDVVARVRRALGERRIGHTGTLDPAASGVLPLVVGRATRLAQFLSASDKSYDAVVRLGFATDTARRGRASRSAPSRTAPLPVARRDRRARSTRSAARSCSSRRRSRRRRSTASGATSSRGAREGGGRRIGAAARALRDHRPYRATCPDPPCLPRASVTASSRSTSSTSRRTA